MTGPILSLARWALHTACWQAPGWYGADGGSYVSMNFSGRQFEAGGHRRRHCHIER